MPSKQELMRIKLGLMDKDLMILSTINAVRLITTSTLRKLFFYDYASESTAMRLTTLRLKKLSDLGLIKPSATRVNRKKGGRLQNVWMLTVAGYRLLCLEHPEYPNKRFVEPSLVRLNHTIAISGCCADIVECCREDNSPDLYKVEFEPVCWRDLGNQKSKQLKPDLYIELCGIEDGAKYTERSFWEIDLGTESTDSLLTKCERYHAYYRSRIEQQAHGDFPMVIWFVLTQKRKDQLIGLLSSHYADHKHLFVVILPEELPRLIRDGVEKGEML